jgi:hypothetical protein
MKPNRRTVQWIIFIGPVRRVVSFATTGCWTLELAPPVADHRAMRQLDRKWGKLYSSSSSHVASSSALLAYSATIL